MNIVADQNIPLAEEAFRPFGEVHLRPGRALTREDLRNADAVIVRSVTPLNAELLDNTPVRFAGTATIGTDHVDQEYLRGQGIRFASAAGCNARSVVEYVLTALAEYCVSRGIDWADRTLGIVGHGNIGSHLAVRARGLGMRVLVNDPPLARQEDSPDLVDLETLLRSSDFVTLHVPYTETGPDPTDHLIDEARLAQMKPGTLLINSSRGPVFDNGAVIDNGAAREAVHIDLILDVFEGEPRPNRDLVRRCFLATPHIAGYSYEGKVNGTHMMAMALGRFLNAQEIWSPKLPPPPEPNITLRTNAGIAALLEAMRHSYPIREDDQRLRDGLDLPDEEWGKHFDTLRRDYPRRREFANYEVVNPPENPETARRLRVLHFLK